MVTNKMREQFEAWMHREFSWPLGLLSLAWDESTGTYKEASFHIGWTAWKASREAVVVELPPVAGAFADVQKFTRNGCREAIEAHGLKVRP